MKESRVRIFFSFCAAFSAHLLVIGLLLNSRHDPIIKPPSIIEASFIDSNETNAKYISISKSPDSQPNTESSSPKENTSPLGEKSPAVDQAVAVKDFSPVQEEKPSGLARSFIPAMSIPEPEPELSSALTNKRQCPTHEQGSDKSDADSNRCSVTRIEGSLPE